MLGKASNHSCSCVTIENQVFSLKKTFPLVLDSQRDSDYDLAWVIYNINHYTLIIIIILYTNYQYIIM